MQMPPDMVIFDCDGVIVDSEGITNRVIQENLKTYGLDLALDEIMRLFVGGTMQGVMDLARDMGAKLPDSWLDEIYPEMHAALAIEVEAVPRCDCGSRCARRRWRSLCDWLERTSCENGGYIGAYRAERPAQRTHLFA